MFVRWHAHMMYRMMPAAHTSTSSLYGRFCSTSGAARRRVVSRHTAVCFTRARGLFEVQLLYPCIQASRTSILTHWPLT